MGGDNKGDKDDKDGDNKGDKDDKDGDKGKDKKDPICLLEKEVGRCKKYVPRFYYDSDSDECKEFVFGGCDGNANNFKTEKDCAEACKDKKDKPKGDKVLCNYHSDCPRTRPFCADDCGKKKKDKDPNDPKKD